MVEMHSNNLFTVINVWRGVVTKVEVYYDLQEAVERQKEWQKDIHPVEDDVVVYETEIKSRAPVLS